MLTRERFGRRARSCADIVHGHAKRARCAIGEGIGPMPNTAPRCSLGRGLGAPSTQTNRVEYGPRQTRKRARRGTTPMRTIGSVSRARIARGCDRTRTSAPRTVPSIPLFAPASLSALIFAATVASPASHKPITPTTVFRLPCSGSVPVVTREPTIPTESGAAAVSAAHKLAADAGTRIDTWTRMDCCRISTVRRPTS